MQHRARAYLFQRNLWILQDILPVPNMVRQMQSKIEKGEFRSLTGVPRKEVNYATLK
jgi:hypothetical protein